MMKYISLLVLMFCIPLIRAQDRGLILKIPIANIVSPDSTFVLLVGVSEYEYIKKLDYAHLDAQMFHDFLVSPKGEKVPEKNVKMLLNKEATRNSFLNNIYSFLGKNVNNAKRIIIYFAGHGDADAMGEQFLLTSACNPANDVGNYAATDAVSVNDIKEKIKFFAHNGVEVILAIDACRTNKLLLSSKSASFDVSSAIEQSEGEILFLGCEKGQVSQESSKWGNGHGLFTYYLIKGLSGNADRNNDHYISIEEIKHYTEDAMFNDSDNIMKQAPVWRYPLTPSSTNIFKYQEMDKMAMLSKGTSNGNNDHYRSMERGVSTAPEDINLSKFYLYISEKKYIEPENNCALGYIFLMSKTKAKPEDIITAKNILGIAMLDSCIRIMNLYINGVDKLGDYEYHIGKIFSSGKVLFARAKELLKDIDPEICEANKTMELFFEGRSILEIQNKEERLSNIDVGLKATNNAISIRPNAAYLYHLKALLLMSVATKDPALRDSAIKAENIAIKLAPNWINPYITMAGLYFSKYKFDKALDYYKQSLQIDSNSYLPYIGLGNVYKKTGKYNIAIGYYSTSITKDSLNPAAYYNRGMVYIVSNQAEKARMDFEKCLQIDSLYYDAHISLASYYEIKGRYIDALAQYEIAYKIDKAALNDLLNGEQYFYARENWDAVQSYKIKYEELDR